MHWIMFMASIAWHNFFTFSQKNIAFTFSHTASSVIFIVQLHLTSSTKVYGLGRSVRFWKPRRYLHSILVLYPELSKNLYTWIFVGILCCNLVRLLKTSLKLIFSPSLRSFHNFVQEKSTLQELITFLINTESLDLSPLLALSLEELFTSIWIGNNLHFANLEDASWFRNGIVSSRILLGHS